MSADDQPPALPPVDPATADRLPGETITPELLASLLADGDDELAAWVLEQALRDAPRAEVYDGLLADAMRLVGERWASGQWSVAEEHLASQTLLRAMDRIRPELGPESRIGPLAVLAAVAGEHHMIGLVCLDHVLRERGWAVANLGADVPTADLVRFLERNDARLLAVTASHPDRVGTVAEALQAVRQTGARADLMLGGRLAATPGVEAAVGADWAGSSLVAATAHADQVLTRLSTGRA